MHAGDFHYPSRRTELATRDGRFLISEHHSSLDRGLLRTGPVCSEVPTPRSKRGRWSGLNLFVSIYDLAAGGEPDTIVLPDMFNCFFQVGGAPGLSHQKRMERNSHD